MRSPSCWTCRSTISCFARKACIANTSMRMRCSCRRCSRSRPAAARRIAAYCPQAARYHTGVENEELLPLDEVVAAARAAREGAGRDALLHGRRVARTRRSASSSRCRDGQGGERARPGNLRDARHAEARAGRAAERRRPRLLQPQPRHRARVLRRDHHRRARTRTGSTRSSDVRDAGIHVCCGGIVGMGETRRTRAALDRAAREPRSLSRESVPINNLVQVEGTPLARHRARSIRSNSCARSPSRASRCRKAMVRLSAGRAGDGRRRCRRCASSPAPTRSSTATSC